MNLYRKPLKIKVSVPVNIHWL